MLRTQRLLRVNSSGGFDDLFIVQWAGQVSGDPYFERVGLITNADTCVLMTVGTDSGTGFIVATTGTSVSVQPLQIPWQPAVGAVDLPSLTPVLQAEDGSFIGVMKSPVGYAVNSYTAAFDASGNIRWSVPNDTPVIAKADGGVIGRSGVAYDRNGGTTGQGLLGTTQTQGWFGNVLGTSYGMNSNSVSSFRSQPTSYAATFAALSGGNVSAHAIQLVGYLISPFAYIEQVAARLVNGGTQLPNLAFPPPRCYPPLVLVTPPVEPPTRPTCGNINAIEILTSQTPDSIFQQYLQTFKPVAGNGDPTRSPNSIMSFSAASGAPLNVTAPGQIANITIKIRH